jgi:hypothetical protein
VVSFTLQPTWTAGWAPEPVWLVSRTKKKSFPIPVTNVTNCQTHADVMHSGRNKKITTTMRVNRVSGVGGGLQVKWIIDCFRNASTIGLFFNTFQWNRVKGLPIFPLLLWSLLDTIKLSLCSKLFFKHAIFLKIWLDHFEPMLFLFV